MAFFLPSPTFTSTVFHGDKEGRTIGFPTLNLDSAVFPQEAQAGVYAATVVIRKKHYQGALYFGPRTVHGEEKNVLEIFVLDFAAEVYGETVSFQLIKFIRPVIHFSSLEQLQTQLKQDVADVLATQEHRT